MRTIEIVDFRADLLEDAARLRSETWGGSPAVNLAYLEWKYGQNPYLPEPVVQFALAEGRVTGLRASVGTCWEVPGTRRRHVIPHGADALVNPTYRGRGVFRALIARAKEAHRERGFGQTITLSANAVSEAVLESEGWSAVGALEMLERRSAPSPRPRSRVARLAGKALPSRPIADVFGRLDALRVDGVTVAAAPRPEAMAELCRRRPATDRLRHVRDEAYFGWRYGNPLADYRCLFLDGDRLDAFAVIQWGRSDPVVNLIDWSSSTVEALSTLLDTLERGGFDCIRTWSSTLADGDAACLAARGYRAAPRESHGVSFLLRPLTGSEQAAWLIDGVPIRTLDGWSVRMADSDAY